MIVSYSTVEELGVGFRERLFLPRWKVSAEKLKDVVFPMVEVLRVRLIIGHVEWKRDVQGFEDELKFVVENRIPMKCFQQFSIREKNDLVLDTIFESIKATYAHFGEPTPPEIDQIWHEVRGNPNEVMLDAQNPLLQQSSANRSAGAKLKQTYLPPEVDETAD